MLYICKLVCQMAEGNAIGEATLHSLHTPYTPLFGKQFVHSASGAEASFLSLDHLSCHFRALKKKVLLFICQDSALRKGKQIYFLKI